MLVYTSAKLSNYFLGAVSSRFCVTSKSNKCIITSLGNPLIHYFHIHNNAPCLPPKFCINILFNIQYFSWDDCNIQDKLKTKCKILGVNKVHFLDMSGKDGKIIEKWLRMRKFCQTPPKLCFNNQPLVSISRFTIT